jgi:hypothetical protein
MARRALGTILLGRSAPVEAGQEIPATFIDDLGAELPVDFDRLEALGLVADEAPAEKPDEKPAPKPKRSRKPKGS